MTFAVLAKEKMVSRMRLIDADKLREIYMNKFSLIVDRYGAGSSASGVLMGAIKLLDIQDTIEGQVENTGEGSYEIN